MRFIQASNRIRSTSSSIVSDVSPANTLVRFQKAQDSLMHTLNDAPSTVFNVKGEEIEFIDPAIMFKAHFGTNKKFEAVKRTLDGNPEAVAKLEKIRAINKTL